MKLKTTLKDTQILFPKAIANRIHTLFNQKGLPAFIHKKKGKTAFIYDNGQGGEIYRNTEIKNGTI